MTDDPYQQALRERDQLRARLRDIEARAAAMAAPPTLGDLVEKHYADPAIADAAELRRLRALAHGFVPDRNLDQELASRERDPDAWDRAGGGGMAGFALSDYSQRRAAYEKLQKGDTE